MSVDCFLISSFTLKVHRALVNAYQFPPLKAKIIELLLTVEDRGDDLIFKLLHTRKNELLVIIDRFFLRFVNGLSLHTTVGIATSKAFHLGSRNKVEVARYGVLQGTGSNGKLESLALSSLGQQSMNEST